MSEQLFCPNCGMKNLSDSRFCENCGTDLTQLQNSQKTELTSADSVKEPSAINSTQPIAAADLVDLDQKKYQSAIEAFSSGDLALAETLFTSLGSYQDAPEKLQMVQKAQESQREKAYQTGIAAANNAVTATELQKAVAYLQSFDNYRDAAQRIKEYQVHYEELLAQEKLIRLNKKQRKKKILIAVAALLLIVLGTGGYIIFQKQEVNQLAKAVAEQRQDNVNSFDNLDKGVKEQISEMFESYQANTKDYTYKVTEKTDQYVIVNYTFKGPDKAKDRLPKQGTRLSDNENEEMKVALSRD